MQSLQKFMVSFEKPNQNGLYWFDNNGTLSLIGGNKIQTGRVYICRSENGSIPLVDLLLENPPVVTTTDVDYNKIQKVRFGEEFVNDDQLGNSLKDLNEFNRRYLRDNPELVVIRLGYNQDSGVQRLEITDSKVPSNLISFEINRNIGTAPLLTVTQHMQQTGITEIERQQFIEQSLFAHDKFLFRIIGADQYSVQPFAFQSVLVGEGRFIVEVTQFIPNEPSRTQFLIIERGTGLSNFHMMLPNIDEITFSSRPFPLRAGVAEIIFEKKVRRDICQLWNVPDALLEQSSLELSNFLARTTSKIPSNPSQAGMIWYISNPQFRRHPQFFFSERFIRDVNIRSGDNRRINMSNFTVFFPVADVLIKPPTPQSVVNNELITFFTVTHTDTERVVIRLEYQLRSHTIRLTVQPQSSPIVIFNVDQNDCMFLLSSQLLQPTVIRPRSVRFVMQLVNQTGQVIGQEQFLHPLVTMSSNYQVEFPNFPFLPFVSPPYFGLFQRTAIPF